MVHSRAFAASLAVSTLLHLSAVTIFSIVILFPRHKVDYYTFEIVSARKGARQAEIRPESLKVRPPREALSLMDEPSNGLDMWSEIPAIELPQIEFAQLERLGVRTRGLEIGSRFDALFEEEPKDSWAWFGRELESLGGALMRLAPGRQDDKQNAPQLVTRPAAGFEGYVEWMAEPKDRGLVFAPPIDALWGLKPESLDESLVFIFTVDPEGRVSEVLPPVGGNADIIDSAGIALSKYRFEPLESEGPARQQATFIIAAARSKP